MEVLVERDFEHEGESYEPGKKVDLPKEVARGAIENGVAKSISGMGIKSTEDFKKRSEEADKQGGSPVHCHFIKLGCNGGTTKIAAKFEFGKRYRFTEDYFKESKNLEWHAEEGEMVTFEGKNLGKASFRGGDGRLVLTPREEAFKKLEDANLSEKASNPES